MGEKKEEILPLLSEEGYGNEAREEPQKPTTRAINSPLPSPDPVHTLLSPTTQFTPEALGPKAHASPSLLVQNFKKLVATVQTFATTSKTLAATHAAWHSGWFGCWSNSLQRLKELVWGRIVSPTFCFHLFLFYFDFFSFSS